MADRFYNIAMDCIDRPANTESSANKTALLFVSQSENEKRFSTHPFSFQQLKEKTAQLANALQPIISNANERLVIRLPNSPEFPIAFIGAIKAGMIPIPTSPLFTYKELKFILEDSEASVLVTTSKLLPPDLSVDPFPFLKRIILVSSPVIPAEAGIPLEQFTTSTRSTNQGIKGDSCLRRNDRVIYWEEMSSCSSDFEVEPTLAGSPAYWLYTSGTEGKPKGVIHSHQSIAAHDLRIQYWQALREDENEVVFNTSSLNWSYALTAGMLDLWRHHQTALIYAGALNAEAVSQVVKENAVTLFMSVPAIYRRLTEFLKPEDDFFSKVKTALSAGEKLSLKIKTDFERLTQIRIREGLGMTEQSVYLVQRSGEFSPPESCGKPLDDKTKILREDLTEADPQEVGMIATDRSSTGLMLGYYRCPEEEKKVFQNEWFLSGDFAYRDDQNNYFFVGRKDDLITAGGFRISPLEVESVLNLIPSVLESAVVGEEVESGKTIVVAFVVLKREYLSDLLIHEKILKEAEKKLAKYKVPRKIILANELPKTSQGKLKRKELLKYLD